MLENVPGLKAEARFRGLVDELSEDYAVTEQIVQATDFGVPQRRRRIIVVGVDRELGVTPPGDLLAALPDGFDVSARTAGDALATAVTLSPELDPLHRARTPRPKTLARIKATKQGRGRLDLPPDYSSNATQSSTVGTRHRSTAGSTRQGPPRR